MKHRIREWLPDVMAGVLFFTAFIAFYILMAAW